MSTPSQEAFLALDPILKMLLSSVESYRGACTTDNSQSEERILGMLRVQVRLLDNLERAVKGTVEKHGAGALQGLMDYILLPLRLILQSSEWDDAEEPIRQSAAWKTSEAAARVMDCIYTLAGPRTSLKQTLDCLTSCSFPLPKEKMASKGLDRGDDCLYAVLHCINTLLERTNLQKSHTEELCMAMEGRLVALISFACTNILAPAVDNSSRKSSPEVLLQALETLDTLMKAAPVPEMWQSYFPGLIAVLCGLVLSDLRLAPAQASPKVSSHSCCTLSRLLSVTLSTAKKQTDDPINAWTRVQNIATDGDTAQLNTSPFLTEVYTRLPAPLILLLNLLPTASSPKLRQAASQFCHSILVETRSVWDQEETSNVLRSGIECCIALSRDKDERVVSAAKSVIAGYRRDSGKQKVDNTIGPRILELIEELPALARSGRETELRGKINLIGGYLTLGVSLRSSLTSVATEIQNGLAVLFDVDFDSIQYAPRVETTDAWDVWQPDQCRFRYMMDDTASAREMVHLLGDALGQRGASSFVDACVANVLEACVAANHTLFGPRQVDWLHQWIGFIIISNEILVGAFKESPSPTGGDNEHPTRHKLKKLRRLNTLAAAILPVVTSTPLWTLPTVLDNVDQTRINENKADRSLTITEIQDEAEIRVEAVSASALKGNAAMVCSLIGLVNETVDLLVNDAESFLPITLYPLCERASSHNHSQVQRAAGLALQQYAVACGLESTRDLLRQNFDYLFGAMLSRTRRPGGEQTARHTSFPTAIPSIVQAVLRSATDVDTTTVTNGVPCERSLSDETCVSYVIELGNALVASFDNNLVILNSDPSLRASIALDLVQVFDASLSFIASTFGVDLRYEEDPSADVQMPETTEDWMKVLEPFKRNQDLDSDCLSAKEGFQTFQREKGGQNESDDAASTNTDDEQISIQITDNELEFVSLALARCSFFLSSPKLQLEMASCTGMQHAFALLGLVAKHSQPKKDDEPNGPETAILRHISVSYPSIISRIRSLSSTVVTATSIKAVSIRSLQVHTSRASPDLSTQMIFLSKLFDLLACMVEVSESFMVDRIRHHVWPVIAELLNVYVQLEKNNSQKQTSRVTLVSNEVVRKKTFVTEREKLLFSILDFLQRIYGVRECGLGLADLIPVAGTILLPFLANEGELRDRTMKTLKQMMLIDCDALWRPLLQLGHRPLPPRPFEQQDTSTVVVNENQVCTTPLELAAEELIDFVEALPEQSLDIY